MPYQDDDVEALSDERPSLFAFGGRMMRYLAALMLLPISLFTFWPPLNDEKMGREIVQHLKVRRDTLRAQAGANRQKLELLRTDPEYLEIMARDRLQLHKEGETIVRFDNE
jgi:hypothetical protein